MVGCRTLRARRVDFEDKCVCGCQDVRIQVGSRRVAIEAEVIRVALKADAGKGAGDGATGLKIDGNVEDIAGALLGERATRPAAGEVRSCESHAVIAATL